MRYVDEATRHEASKKRLDSLENDNFIDEQIYDKDEEFKLTEGGCLFAICILALTNFLYLEGVLPPTKKKKTEKEARRARERRFKAPSSVKTFNQLMEFEVLFNFFYSLQHRLIFEQAI